MQYSIAATLNVIIATLRLVLAPSKADEGVTRLLVALRAYHWTCRLDWVLSLWLDYVGYGWKALTEWDQGLIGKLSPANKARLLLPEGECEVMAGKLKEIRFIEHPTPTDVIQRADGTWRIRFDGLTPDGDDYEMVKVVPNTDGLDPNPRYEILDHTVGMKPFNIHQRIVGPFELSPTSEDEEEEGYW